METQKKRVLVTGVTGFLGCQIAKDLLERGYLVRGTVRSLLNQTKLKPVKSLPNQENLELIETDLLKPDNWDKAVSNCDYVLHVASPYVTSEPKNEDELIKPAVNGTATVLKACADHKEVKHVVVTSSIAAILSLGKNGKEEYTEDDWPVMDNLISYNKSKTLAEKECWKIYEQLDKNTRFKLTTINPGYIFGPTLVSTGFSSGDIIKQILTGSLISIPQIYMPIVDVRDVSIAHIKAMESDKTDGQRYICAQDHLWMTDIAKMIKDEYGKYGYSITTNSQPYFVFYLASFFDRQAVAALPFWGCKGHLSNNKIVKDLDMKFIGAKEAIFAMVDSLINLKIVEDLTKPKISEGVKK